MSDGGKGSRPRPFSISQSTFASNWDAIFGNKEKNMQVRVEQISEGGVKCGCGRSPTGFCIGWHGLAEEEFQKKLAEYLSNQQEDGK